MKIKSSFLLVQDTGININETIWLKSAEGFDPVADVTETLDPVVGFKKYVSNFRYKPMVIKPMFPFNGTLLSIINVGMIKENAFNGKININYDHHTQRQLEFSNSIIHEIIFPGANIKSKEAGHISFSMDAESIKETISKPAGKETLVKAQESPWLTSRFSFNISGIENIKVAAVDSFRLTRNITSDQIGIFREPVKSSSNPFHMPNLRITVTDDSTTSLYNWSQDWFVNGNHLEANEKSATLICFSADNKKLLELDFTHVGLAKVSITTKGYIVDLYFEQVSFNVPIER